MELIPVTREMQEIVKRSREILELSQIGLEKKARLGKTFVFNIETRPPDMKSQPAYLSRMFSRLQDLAAKNSKFPAGLKRDLAQVLKILSRTRVEKNQRKAA